MNEIKFICLIIFEVLITLNAFGQGDLIQPDTIKCEDPKLKALISEPLILTLSVDFTGDNKQDFICRVKSDNYDKGDIKEIWVDHDYNIDKINYRWGADYDYYWFVNLDADKEPEIFSAYGYPDGIDYAFYDQDFKNKRDEILFYFAPIITESPQANKIYWGYPWDITGLFLKNEIGVIKILASTNHDIKPNGEKEYPSNQTMLPVICFKGISSQPDVEIEEIRDIKWLSVEELKSKISK